jgi:hypothetical protein
MHQWRRFIALNQALNRFRSFPPAKAAAVAAAHALVAAGCGIQAEEGKDPITNVHKVDELLAVSSVSAVPAASKVVCLSDDHKDRASRTKLAVTAAIVFAFRMQTAFAIPASADEFGYSEYALTDSAGPTPRDLFVLKLEQLISNLKDMDADSKEVHALAAHIFPQANTTRAVNMFFDHVESLVGSIGSVLFTNLWLAIPRQSPPNCVQQPTILTGGAPFAQALQLAAGCESGGDVAAGLAKLNEELGNDKLLQYNLLKNRQLLSLLTGNYTFWKRIEREVDLNKFAPPATGKKKFSFVEVDKSTLTGLFQRHWQALSAVILGTDFAKQYAPACPCACKGAKPESFNCPVDTQTISLANATQQRASHPLSKAGGFFAALQPDHPLQAAQVAAV